MLLRRSSSGGRKRTRTQSALEFLSQEWIAQDVVGGSVLVRDEDGEFQLGKKVTVSKDTVFKMLDSCVSDLHFVPTETGTIQVEFGKAMNQTRISAVDDLLREPDRQHPLQSVVEIVAPKEVSRYLHVMSLIVKCFAACTEPVCVEPLGERKHIVTEISSIWTPEMVRFVKECGVQLHSFVFFWAAEGRLRMKVFLKVGV